MATQDVASGHSGISPLDLAVTRIETLVFDELEPGDQLPAEGALGEELGVSRLTVREAMKQASARGLVEIRNGRKPTVAIPNGRGVGDYFRSAIRRDARALLELLDVRMALEVHNSGLAALNAGRASIDAMSALVVEMEASIDSPDAFNENDMRFHELLATATGNRMLSTLIEELAGCLRTSRTASVAGHARRGLSLTNVVAEHRAILLCIENHDPRGAEAAMQRHLKHTGKDLEAALDAAISSQ